MWGEKGEEGSVEGFCSLPNVWVLLGMVWVERGRGQRFLRSSRFTEIG